MKQTQCDKNSKVCKTEVPKGTDIFHLREANVRQKIAQLIFSLHKDIVFRKVVRKWLQVRARIPRLRF